MNWFTVLKMPNPHGGKWSDLTSDEYHRMDNKNKERYHHGMGGLYDRQIKLAVEPRKAGQAPPATDEQIRELRELSRFHSRQRLRIRGKLGHNGIDKDSYYSLEDETNRTTMKPKYDAVERVPTTTKEMYDNYSRDEKERYWARLHKQLNVEYGKEHPKVNLANRMYNRMKDRPYYTPPFEGDELTEREFRDLYFRDVSEYYDFTDNEKRNLHRRLARRKGNDGDLEGSKWHFKMADRATNSITRLPTYPTPEAQKEAEQ